MAINHHALADPRSLVGSIFGSVPKPKLEYHKVTLQSQHARHGALHALLDLEYCK